MLTGNESKDKIERVLNIYTKLMKGGLVNKAEEAQNCGVNERSIQRDLEDIRDFMDLNAGKDGVVNTVVYDRVQKGYRLEKTYQPKFSNPEVLAICKILLESRAFTKKEMEEMLHKLIESCVPKNNRKFIEDLIRNEEFHYIEPHHKTVFMDKLWDIAIAIHENRYIEIQYKRIKDNTVKTRKLKPLAILFSEYYFYLTAFIDDETVQKDFKVPNDAYPTIYRIDRIKALKVLDEQFHIPYANRFEEGEFRKRVQFMSGGELKKIRFEYTGYSVEAILDRLPTAKVEKVENGKYTISAEVFGDGVDMWLRSQGDRVRMV